MRDGPRIGTGFLLLATLLSFGTGRPASAALILRDVNVTLNATTIESYGLDVDRNGTVDFTFTAAFAPDPFLSVGFDVVDFPFGSNNGVVIDPRVAFDGFPTASRLAVGDGVSAASLFSIAGFEQGNLFFFTTFDPPSGNFLGRTGYLGLRFDGAGGPLFGFAQVTVNGLTDPNNPLGLTIGTVGYSDVPGQPVRVTTIPEPVSLLVFAGGGIGLLVRRRRNGG